jgi:hypothetical protein
MQQQYLGYRMALEDLYFGLYEEDLPEPQRTPTVEAHF